jgi:hypothetical protein
MRIFMRLPEHVGRGTVTGVIAEAWKRLICLVLWLGVRDGIRNYLITAA